MDALRFEAIIAAYGADPRRWPPAERVAAEAFAAAHPDAGAGRAEARDVDALLAMAMDDAPASLAFTRRLLATAPKPKALGWRPAAAMAACALLGVVLGLGGARYGAETAQAEAALNLAFGEGIGG